MLFMNYQSSFSKINIETNSFFFDIIFLKCCFRNQVRKFVFSICAISKKILKNQFYKEFIYTFRPHILSIVFYLLVGSVSIHINNKQRLLILILCTSRLML